MGHEHYVIYHSRIMGGIIWIIDVFQALIKRII